MSATSLLLVLSIAAVLLYGVIKLLLVPRKKSIPLPPGPKALPIVGNIADLPPAGAREWEHWRKHKDLYGPISSLTVFGTTIVIISDAALAYELMEKRGNIHSSRLHFTFGMKMCGWEHILVSQLYTDRLRTYRRQIHQSIGTKAALSKFYPLQDVEVHRFLLRTLQRPESLVQNIRTETGAIILKITYGYTVEPHETDQLVDTVDRALAQFSAAAVPGAWLVDTIPALRYLPEWMPGTGFKKTAREWKATLMETVEKPIGFVKQQIAEKQNEPSYVSNLYEKAGGWELMGEEEQYVTKWSAASLYTGGADTSVSTIETFFLAMTLHSEVQRKAQEEIDRVVGSHRLPTFDDRDNLPYVEAVVKECFRWHPIAPMGIPHVSTEDDVCEGYLIPKGAMVIPNIWLFTHDPDVYHNPMSFDPERFFSSSPPPDPTNFIFGFGRRICPGKLLAESSVWLTVAKSLAAFDIRKGIEDGKEVEPSVQFTSGIISHPYPFKTSIKARDTKHEELIRAVESEHPWEQSSAKALESIKL